MASKIVVVPEAVLRKHALVVTSDEFSSQKLYRIIEDMTKALRGSEDGIGIAAPQIGVSKRIFLASEETFALDLSPGRERKKKNWEYFIFINPKIVKRSNKKTSATEGCLSVPKKYGTVERAEKVRVRAYDMEGKVFERGASGLFARLLQHEIDHLEGKLFIDRAKKLISVS